MSTITKYNYEAYLLDYVEGNLSLELVSELMLFLENNPKYKIELEDFIIHELVPPISDFDDKGMIKNEITEITLINYEEYLIESVEGTLSDSMESKLSSFLKKYPKKGKELDLYRRVKLEPPGVVFHNKQILKRQDSEVFVTYWWYATAAALILMILIPKVLVIEKGEGDFISEIDFMVEIQTEKDLKKSQVIEELPSELLSHEVSERQPSDKKIKKANNQPVKFTRKEHSESTTENNDKEKIEKRASFIEPMEATPEGVLAVDSTEENKLIVDEKYDDNVRIIFEDDEPVLRKRRETTFKGPGEIVRKPFHEKIVRKTKDEEGQIIAYQFKLGPFGFRKHGRKKQ